MTDDKKIPSLKEKNHMNIFTCGTLSSIEDKRYPRSTNLILWHLPGARTMEKPS